MLQSPPAADVPAVTAAGSGTADRNRLKLTITRLEQLPCWCRCSTDHHARTKASYEQLSRMRIRGCSGRFYKAFEEIFRYTDFVFSDDFPDHCGNCWATRASPRPNPDDDRFPELVACILATSRMLFGLGVTTTIRLRRRAALCAVTQFQRAIDTRRHRLS